MLERLGGKEGQRIQDCTHLVADKFNRTGRFLLAITLGRWIVHPAWLEESFENRYFLDETPFILQDKQAETIHRFSLRESLQRARLHPLLHGMVFFALPHVLPDMEMLRQLIMSAGGELLSESPLRGGILVRSDVIILASERNRKRCEPFRQACPEIRIYSMAFLLEGLLTQRLDFYR
jgi:hypothetical protein